MRVPFVLFVGFVVLVSGCSGKPRGETPTLSDPSTSRPPEPDANVVTSLDVERLPPGRMYNYTAKGSWDIEADYDVVVASQGAGYLFAAPSKQELTSLITWDRPWYGYKDASLNLLDKDGEVSVRFFDFPLTDGKSWLLTADGPRMTAKASMIKTPGGTEAGFVVEGAREDRRYAYDYAPSVGYFVHFQRWTGDQAEYDVTLTKITTSDTWFWFEELGRTMAELAEGSAERAVVSFDVPASAEVLSAIGYGYPRTQGALLPPEAPVFSGWSFEGRGCCSERDSWIATQIPAIEGPWTLAVAGDVDDYIGLEVTAAKWVTGAP